MALEILLKVALTGIMGPCTEMSTMFRPVTGGHGLGEDPGLLI